MRLAIPFNKVVPMRRRGFTLIELMVVLAIIGLMLCLFLPAVISSQAAARRVQCANNLRQVSLGLLNYQLEHEFFPPGYTLSPDAAGSGWGWAARMLPQIEQLALAGMIDPTEPFESTANHTVRVCRLSTMICPTDLPRGDLAVFSVNLGGKTSCNIAASNYVGSFGTGDPLDPAQADRGDGVFFRDSAIGLDHLMDGTSATFLIGERGRDSGPTTWTGAVGVNGPALVLGSTGGEPGPNARPRRITRFSSRHDGGAYFGFGDGGVRFITDDVGPAVYAALATRKGGEIVPDLEE